MNGGGIGSRSGGKEAGGRKNSIFKVGSVASNEEGNRQGSEDYKGNCGADDQNAFVFGQKLFYFSHKR